MPRGHPESSLKSMRRLSSSVIAHLCIGSNGESFAAAFALSDSETLLRSFIQRLVANIKSEGFDQSKTSIMKFFWNGIRWHPLVKLFTTFTYTHMLAGSFGNSLARRRTFPKCSRCNRNNIGAPHPQIKVGSAVGAELVLF